MTEFDVETAALRAAMEIQAAYEEHIEGDSETLAFLMIPIMRELARAQEAAREQAELACIKAVCAFCDSGSVPRRRVFMAEVAYSHEFDQGEPDCAAAGIHELRRRRAEQTPAGEER